MKTSAFFFCTVLFLILYSYISLAVEFSVGVSPSILDVGEVEKGSTKSISFYLVTVSNESLLVRLEPEKGRLDFFNKGDYKDLIFNYSEEDTTDWIKFLNNPINIDPENKISKLPQGIKGWKEVNFLLTIPKDAEPGYHIINIKPIPYVSEEKTGRVGIAMIAATSINIIFKVSGNAVRRGVILDTVTGNYIGKSDLGINTYFQNIGTTTVTARATQEIYDKNGSFIEKIQSDVKLIKPKQIETFESALQITGLSVKDYNVFTSVDYITGSDLKNFTISLKPSASIIELQKEPFKSFWVVIIVVVIIVIAIFIYRWIR